MRVKRCETQKFAGAEVVGCGDCSGFIDDTRRKNQGQICGVRSDSCSMRSLGGAITEAEGREVADRARSWRSETLGFQMADVINKVGTQTVVSGDTWKHKKHGLVVGIGFLRRSVSVLLVSLCCVVLWGCSNKAKPNIEAENPYFMTYLVPYTFFYNMEKDDDHSFLEFDKDFKNMWISFDTLSGHQRVEFVVTSCKFQNGQVKGTVSRIEAHSPDTGKLLRYAFWSDDTTIYLQSLVNYRVYTATDSHELVTVARDQTVAMFARTTPGYIGGGS